MCVVYIVFNVSTYIQLCPFDWMLMIMERRREYHWNSESDVQSSSFMEAFVIVVMLVIDGKSYHVSEMYARINIKYLRCW